MTPSPAIQIEGVSKRYPVFTHPWKALRYLAALIRHGVPDEGIATSGVQALSDINLEIGKGERVGLVGRNGAGKSTLLKLLAGNFPPATGRISICGSVHCLLPGSVSFSFEQSTEDNARQYLSYRGLSPEERQTRVEEIKDFTELGEYFGQPVKNLSLGMRVRAEFAVATAYSADIVVIDEVLGAGDIYWSEKIARRMDRLCAGGTTLLLVSHSLSQINRYCERAVWIERGKIVMDGPALEVTKRYEGFLERLSWQTDDVDDKSLEIENLAAGMGNEVLPDSGQTVVRWPGRGDVIVSGIWINNQPASSINLPFNEPCTLSLNILARKSGDYRLRYLFTFFDQNGRRAAVIENQADSVSLELGHVHCASVRCPNLRLACGRYDLTLTLLDAFRTQETTSEAATRMDVLYKSFQLKIVDANYSACNSPCPKYSMVLTPF